MWFHFTVVNKPKRTEIERTGECFINSLTPGRCGNDFECVILWLTLGIEFLNTSYKFLSGEYQKTLLVIGHTLLKFANLMDKYCSDY